MVMFADVQYVPVGIWRVDSSNTEVGAGNQKRSDEWDDDKQSNDPVDDGYFSALGLCKVDDQSSS